VFDAIEVLFVRLVRRVRCGEGDEEVEGGVFVLLDELTGGIAKAIGDIAFLWCWFFII